MLPHSPTGASTEDDIPVGVYARISKVDGDDTKGVERQMHDCGYICKARRWRIHDYYVDNDVSASSWSTTRPQFNRLIADLESGVIKGVVGYDLDRLFRLPVDLERMIKIYDFLEGLVFATVQGEMNLASTDGITMARVLVAFANKETRNIRRRVIAKHAELARNGIPVGAVRPFGWKAAPETLQALTIAELQGNEVAIAAARAAVRHEERRRVDPFEAELIREGAHDILAGHGVYEICTRWNAMGVKTPRGNVWQLPVIKNLYWSPRLAGYRVYKGDIARDDNGNPVMGQYEPVLDVGTWEAVGKELRERAQTRARPSRRKYLLSGLLRCGICSTRMRPNYLARVGHHVYFCPPRNQGGGCGKVNIHGVHTDELIELLWKHRVAQRSDTGTEIEPWPKEEEIASKAQQIAELMEAYRAKVISSALAFSQVGQLEREIEILKTERIRWVETQHKVGGQAMDPADWDDMTITSRRVELMQHLATVVVHPARPGAPRRFEPSRVEPVWHEYTDALSVPTPRLELVGL